MGDVNMKHLGPSLAIAGIWASVAVMSFAVESVFIVFIALPAMIASIIVGLMAVEE